MKKIFYIVFALFISCGGSNDIKEIEVLSFYNNAKNFHIYSAIDKNGYAQILFKSKTTDFLDSYTLRIRKSLMDSIMNECKNSSEKFTQFKTSKNNWYCGDYHSIQITYTNGRKLNFQYPFANKENKQFIPFQSLFEQIQQDSLKGVRVNIGQLGHLYIKQQNLSDYNFK